MATINAERPEFQTHIVNRVARRVDWAAAERARQAEAARRTVERIAELRHIVFSNAARGNREIEALANESDAAHLLVRAGSQANGFLVLAIVQVSIDRRWGDVVTAGARYFGEHPVAARIDELWGLTQSTAAARSNHHTKGNARNVTRATRISD